jgi:4-diphosphocytidyl-2-C-methyl-D-erythritol kinase
LEDVVLRAYPVVAELKQRMSGLGANLALVSGSGPTVFGLMKDAQMAERAALTLVKTGIRAVACRTLDRNPLFDVML